MVAIKDMEMPSCCYECDLHNYHNCDLTSDDIEKHLDDGKNPNCPLVEVEERKAGKWEEVWESQRDEFTGEYDEWREHKCSVCGFQEFDADRFKYCPCCGAEMRGSENE